MRDNGFNIKEVNTENLTPIKIQNNVPLNFQGCHTAIVDGYVIEGHVPVSEINRLLLERPDVVGLAVAGMPTGSPGMEDPGAVAEAFDVVAFDEIGNIEVYASYP